MQPGSAIEICKIPGLDIKPGGSDIDVWNPVHQLGDIISYRYVLQLDIIAVEISTQTSISVVAGSFRPAVRRIVRSPVIYVGTPTVSAVDKVVTITVVIEKV